MAYAESGDREKALEVWNDGITHGEAPNIALNLRLARALLNWGRLDEANKPMEALEAELANNKKASAASPLANELRLMRCQWHLGRKEFAQALGVLKGVNLSGASGSMLLAILEFNRAACYAGLLQWDQAAAAYDAAAKSASSPLQAWLAAADAWEHAGRSDLALQRYLMAMQKQDFPPKYKVNYARARMAQQMELPAADRNWGQADQALAAAEAAAARRSRRQTAGRRLCTGQGGLVRLATNPGRVGGGRSKRCQRGETMLPALVLAYQQAGQVEKADRA